MARKYIHIINNQSITGGTPFVFNPLLRDVVAGVEQAVAPDIVIAVPKAIDAPSSVTTTPLAVGNITIDHGGGAVAKLFDIMALRLPSAQRLMAAQAPEASADGFITDQHVFFTVLNGVILGKGAVYADNADATRTYTIQVAKAAADGATRVVATRNPTGTAEPAPTAAKVAGQLNLVSGTGDAIVAFSARTYEKSAMSYPTAALLFGGQAYDPQLAHMAFYAPPPAFADPEAAADICIPVPTKVTGLATIEDYVTSLLSGGGPITICSGAAAEDVGAPPHAILFLCAMTVWRVIAAQTGAMNDKRRYFTIGNGVNASQGAIYADNALNTRLYRVIRAKVAGDGSLQLMAVVPTAAVADGPTQNGQLNLVSGTGDAAIAWASGSAAVLQPAFEKYVDIQQNVDITQAGTAFGFQLIENGVDVMPSIVIPIPKAVNTVPYVTTNLVGASAPISILHNNAAPVIKHDVMALRLPSMWVP